MALDKLVDSAQLDSDLTSVANAIRAKSGGSSQLAFPAGFVSEVESISSGGITPSGSIEITTNGTYDVTQKASAVVNVPQGTTPTGTKQVSITQNGTTTEDVTNYASAEITVNVPSSGLNYTIETREVTTSNKAVNLDRAFDNFILIAYLTTAPTAYPNNNNVPATMTAYVDGYFFPPGKHYTVRSSGSAFAGQCVSPSLFQVTATNIAWATYSSNYNVTGNWTFIQIEIPDSFGMYSWQKVAEDIAASASNT